MKRISLLHFSKMPPKRGRRPSTRGGRNVAGTARGRPAKNRNVKYSGFSDEDEDRPTSRSLDSKKRTPMTKAARLEYERRWLLVK